MYKKDIKKIKDNIFFCKNDSGVSFYIDFSFTFEISKINNLKANILTRYLTTINGKYKSQKEIYDKRRELYNSSIYMPIEFYNEKGLILFSYRMIDYRIVKDNYFDDSLDFAYQILFNPCFIDGKLDKDKFKTIKNEMYNEFLDAIKSFNYDSYHNYKKTVLASLKSNGIVYDSKEELLNDLNSITDKDIIDFYNELLSNHYNTILFGNLTNEDINKVIKKFVFKKTDKIKLTCFEDVDLKGNSLEYKTDNFMQSVLYLTYSIKDKEKYANKYFSLVIMAFLNNTDGLLMQLLREKYGLVYHSFGHILDDTNIFCIECYIDKKNKDKTLDAINELYNNIHNRDIVKERLDATKSKIKESIILSSEDPINEYNKTIDIIFNNDLTDREFLNKVLEVQVDDIIDFFDNLENENIYFYIGDKNE